MAKKIKEAKTSKALAEQQKQHEQIIADAQERIDAMKKAHEKLFNKKQPNK